MPRFDLPILDLFRRLMKLALCLALLELAGASVVPGAAAQEVRKPAERPRKKLPKRPRAERQERDDGRDYLRDPEDLPFGSTVWWRAMDLRQRGGFGGDQ